MKQPTPLKAIRAHCLDCMRRGLREPVDCWDHLDYSGPLPSHRTVSRAVLECENTGCALWPWRRGKRPDTEGDE